MGRQQVYKITLLGYLLGIFKIFLPKQMKGTMFTMVCCSQKTPCLSHEHICPPYVHAVKFSVFLHMFIIWDMTTANAKMIFSVENVNTIEIITAI